MPLDDEGDNMSGRITSESVPARNVHGVPYKQLYEAERESSARLIQSLREALEAWKEFDAVHQRDSRRRTLLAEARSITESVLS